MATARISSVLVRKSVRTRPGCCVLSPKLVSMLLAGPAWASAPVASVDAEPSAKSGHQAHPAPSGHLFLCMLFLLSPVEEWLPLVSPMTPAKAHGPRGQPNPKGRANTPS